MLIMWIVFLICLFAIGTAFWIFRRKPEPTKDRLQRRYRIDNWKTDGKDLIIQHYQLRTGIEQGAFDDDKVELSFLKLVMDDPTKMSVKIGERWCKVKLEVCGTGHDYEQALCTRISTLKGKNKRN